MAKEHKPVAHTPDDYNDYSQVKGVPLEQLHEDPMGIELALLRVRHRHEDAGDADKIPFGQMMKEARVDLDQEIEQLRQGKTAVERFGKKGG